MKNKYLLIFNLLNISCISLYAQNERVKGLISGKIIDEVKRPLGYATITLIKATDSSIVKGSLTDEGGNFAFVNIEEGNYSISVSMVSYEKQTKGPFNITPNSIASQLRAYINDLKLMVSLFLRSSAFKFGKDLL